MTWANLREELDQEFTALTWRVDDLRSALEQHRHWQLLKHREYWHEGQRDPYVRARRKVIARRARAKRRTDPRHRAYDAAAGRAWERAHRDDPAYVQKRRAYGQRAWRRLTADATRHAKYLERRKRDRARIRTDAKRSQTKREYQREWARKYRARKAGDAGWRAQRNEWARVAYHRRKEQR
jgi:hypothetical protein